MSFIFFAWVTEFAYATEVLSSKVLSKYRLSNPWLFNFFWSLFILIFTLPLALYFGVSWPKSYGSLIAAGIFYTAIFFVLALYRLDVSVLSPIYNLRQPLSLVLAYFFLAERLSSFQLVLVSIIFVAGILVTVDERWNIKSFLTLGIMFVLLDCIRLSLWSVFINESVAANGYWTTTLFVPLISQTLLLSTIPLFYKDIKSSFKPKNIVPLAVISLVGLVGTLAANAAFARNVSITTVIISLPLSMVIAFLLSVVFPGFLEKHSPKVYLVRFVAAAVMISAAVKLSLM